MTDKESNLRTVLFLVIGILLLLSLFICFFIVISEKDYVETEATVTEINDIEGSNEKEIILEYYDDKEAIQYPYRSKKPDVKINDKVIIYYQSSNSHVVRKNKTSKLIFVCPVVGLIICGIGLFELSKNKSREMAVDYKTSVIGVVGDTKQLKIITDDTPIHEYEKSPEEIAEAQVKSIKKELENIKPIEPIVTPKKAQQPAQVASSTQAAPQIASATVSAAASVNSAPTEPPIPVPKTQQPQKELSVPKASAVKAAEPAPVPAPAPQPNPEAKPVENASQPQTEIVNKIQEAAKNNPSLGEDDIKNMIKDVLKEVISEVQVEKKPEVKVEQRRVLPNYFYISGTSLIYEEPGKEAKEISLKTIKNVTRTINSEGNVVKLVVSNDEIKCILTNMKNIDLEQVANLLHNKMSTIDDNFNEVIEHKEY